MQLDWPRLRLDLISAGATRFHDGIPRSGGWSGWFQHQTLWWVREGAARLRTRRGVATLEPGTLVWYRPGFEYGFEGGIEPALAIDTAHFQLVHTETDQPMDGRVGVEEVMRPGDAGYVGGVMQRVTGFSEHVPGQNHRVFRGHRRARAEALLRELVRELSERHASDGGDQALDDPRQVLLLEMARRIAARPDRAYSVAQLAAEAELSTARFGEHFKRVNRMTPQRFIMEQRMAEATRLLSETVLPVGEVARLSGFSQPQYFTRLFKQRTGQTPRAFRHAARGRLTPPD